MAKKRVEDVIGILIFNYVDMDLLNKGEVERLSRKHHEAAVEESGQRG
jgi:hypothetical protein